MADINCPNCRKDYVARVARVGFAERLFSLIYIYPFKCQLCGRRFRCLQWGVRYLRMEEDRREYERVPAQFSVSFSGDHGAGEGRASDVSMSGCTLSGLTNSPPEGAVLRVALAVAGDGEPIRLDAVVRSARPDRIGLEFLRVDGPEKNRLQHYVRGLLARRAA